MTKHWIYKVIPRAAQNWPFSLQIMKNPIFFSPDAAIFTSFFLDPFSCRDFTDILFLVISFLCMILRQLRPTFLTLSLHKSSFHKAYIFPWQMKKKEKKKAHFRSPTYRECRCAAPTVIWNRTTSNSNCNVCQTEGDRVQSFSCSPPHPLHNTAY